MENQHEQIKEILSRATTIQKHSSSSIKKIKEKILYYEKKAIVPNDQIKLWFDTRSLNYTFPDFFDRLFSEAARENRLDYTNKTIMFCDEDAHLFGFEVGEPVSIYLLFENIPKYIVLLE
jgi:hypothetical protein